MKWIMLLKEIMSFYTFLSARRKINILSGMQQGVFFDRWANSGTEFYVNSEDDVINYFADKNKCIPDAVEELVYSLVEEAVWDNSDENIRKMIDSLYSLVCKPECHN